MNEEELLKRYAAGDRNFSGVDLRNPELAGKDLKKIPPFGGNYNQTS